MRNTLTSLFLDNLINNKITEQPDKINKFMLEQECTIRLAPIRKIIQMESFIDKFFF